MVETSSVLNLSWLVPAFPLAGFVIIGLGNKHLKNHIAGVIASTMTLLSFLMTCVLFFTFSSSGNQAVTQTLFSWISLGEMHISFAFLVDHLSLTMMLIITGVGTLIHVYSIGYMRADERFNTFFAQMNLFTFSMLLLVMAANYLLLFVGWEGVGLCSYLLIGFWYKNNSNNYAARKAFVMNRIGDLGFILGIILIFYTFKSVSFQEVFTKASAVQHGGTLITLITLLLLVGALGKSAQIPLYTWLPDAMAGPTPVSALIHAATMVTAGIYMIARSSILYNLAPLTLDIIIVIGLSTAILAALIGLKQNDIKKVLAYSTVSQLGYMFLALGLGAYSSAVFHVTTHAFFKALLFLGAGSIIHAMGGEQDIRQMGGLRKKMPITFYTFLVATFAISGIPPLSGFFSKDLILTQAYERSPLLFSVALFGAMLTCFYMFRLLFLVFFGEKRFVNLHVHESPKVMIIPLVILGVLSVIGGFLNIPALFGGKSEFTAYLKTSITSIELNGTSISTEWILIAFSLALVGAVIWGAWNNYVKKEHIPNADDQPMRLLPKLLYKRFYIDEAYSFLFEKPYNFLSGFFSEKIENNVLNPIIDGTGSITLRLGTYLRRLQQGNMSFYLFAMVAGILLFIVFILIV